VTNTAKGNRGGRFYLTIEKRERRKGDNLAFWGADYPRAEEKDRAARKKTVKKLENPEKGSFKIGKHDKTTSGGGKKKKKEAEKKAGGDVRRGGGG